MESEPRFRGRSEHSLDSKGRLNIPSRFREVLRVVYGEALVVTNWQKSLKAYPVAEWRKLEEKLLSQGKLQPGFGDFVRYIISGVSECALDKQGRIHLPPSLRNVFGIDTNVVLIGMLDHFEIWDRQAWEVEEQRARDNFQNYEAGLSNLGIL